MLENLMISNSFSWQRKKEIQGFEAKEENYKGEMWGKEGEGEKLLNSGKIKWHKVKSDFSFKYIWNSWRVAYI